MLISSLLMTWAGAVLQSPVPVPRPELAVQAPVTRDLSGRLQAIVQAYHASGQFHGLALVARKGERVGRYTVGQANRSWNVPHDLDAVFPIASLTKQFTAVLVMQAIERGELSMNDTLDRLPGFPEAVGKRVRIEHLLLHSGGFKDPDPAYYRDPRHAGKTDAQIAREFLYAQEPDFVPGTVFRYGNADYHLLGAMLEARTGKSFSELLDERIVKPLGLKQTRLADPDQVRAKRPRDYVREGEHWIHPPQLRWSHWQAAGGLESSLLDLHRWNQALANHELLSPESTQRMLTPPGQPDTYVAYGSWVYDRALPGTDVSLRLAERRGAIGGHAVMNAFDLERGEWVILYSNHGDRTLDSLSYAPCLPLELFTALHEFGPRE